MQSVAKFSFSLAAHLRVVTAEFLEGHVHVTPYTILHETTTKLSECRWVLVMENIWSYGREISIEGYRLKK